MQEEDLLKKPNPGRHWILIALMFTMMLAAMDTTIVSTAIPQIVGDLGDFEKFSWVFSIYLLSQTVTIPIYGKLADIYGRKPVLLIGAGIFLISSGASAGAWDMNSLIIFRGLQGLGAGSIMATVNTLAGDLYSIKERGKVQGWLSSVWGMAAILGPTLGGALAEYATWRWIFLINLPVGIIAMSLLIIYLHEQPVKQKHHLDISGSVLMLISGTLLIFILLEGGQRWPWLSGKGMIFLGLTLLFLLLTFKAERKSPEPVLPKWVWSNRIITCCNLAVTGMGILMIGPNMYLPSFAQSVLQLGAIASGFVLACMSIGWPFASSLSARLYLKTGFRNTSLLGSVIMMAAVAGFLFMPYNASAFLVITDQFILGFGFGFLSTPTLVGIQSIVYWNKRGVVTGSNMFARYLGQSIGAAILGGIFNNAISKSLADAPAQLKSALPQKVDEVIAALQSTKTSVAAENYLRHAFYSATHHVYLGMLIVGLLIFIVLLFLPAHFPLVEDSPDESSK